MSCDRALKHTEDSQDLIYWGLTSLPPDGAWYILGQGSNIAEASRLLLSILFSRDLTYDEALKWLKFAYTGDQLGAYVDPGSTEL